MMGALPDQYSQPWALSCNELFLLYSLHENSAARVTSQAHLPHYHDSHSAGLSQGRIRRPVCLARDFREFLRGIAEHLAAGRTLSASDIRTLNTTLMVPARQKLFQHQNGFHAELFPVRSGWPWILSRIAASLADTLTRYDRERVKICANGGCRWAYYDVTKGKTRRWCNDRTCGNRDRVRRARAAAKRRR